MSNTLERLVAPGIRLMQVARLPMKFAIISAAFMVPLCVAVYGVVSYSKSNIEFAQQEQLGSAFLPSMNKLMASLSARRAGGSSATAAGADALDQARALNDSQDNALSIDQELLRLQAGWKGENLEDVAAQALTLYGLISDNSKLTL